MKKELSVAVIGAGMGGLASAASLRRVGVGVTVYEQAAQFSRLGAGIQIGCNAMQVLRVLGLEHKLRSEAFYARSWNNKDWRTGEIRFDMIFGETAEKKFGAPYLLAHRGDLHSALASAVPDECIKLNHKLTGLEEKPDGVELTFANGSTAVADAVIGGIDQDQCIGIGGKIGHRHRARTADRARETIAPHPRTPRAAAANGNPSR